MGPRGLSLVCRYNLEPDTRLSLAVTIPEKRTIRCTGIVRNLRKSDDGYILGIEFKRLSNRDRNYLKNNLLEIAEIDVLESCRILKDRVHGLRCALDLTVSELSDLTGVPPHRIVQIEYGLERTPPEEVLRSIAAGLGLSVEALVGGDPRADAHHGSL